MGMIIASLFPQSFLVTRSSFACLGGFPWPHLENFHYVCLRFIHFMTGENNILKTNHAMFYVLIINSVTTTNITILKNVFNHRILTIGNLVNKLWIRLNLKVVWVYWFQQMTPVNYLSLAQIYHYFYSSYHPPVTECMSGCSFRLAVWALQALWCVVGALSWGSWLSHQKP